MALVTLEQEPSRALCGGKFAGLAAASRIVSVPPATCLTTEELEEALGPARLHGLGLLMEDLRTTVGAFLLEAHADVTEALRGLSPTNSQRQLLAEAVARLGVCADDLLAVRSSAVEEDGASRSSAGIYTSVLAVRQGVELERAVTACWRSFYGPAALAARIRARDFDPRPGMAVVIQQMVEPEIAGVAFTDQDRLIAEHVPGRSDALVAGAAAPERIVISWQDPPAPDPRTPFLEQLCDALQRLRAVADTDVDVEWAWVNGDLWILQCRPVSARLFGHASTEPYFATLRVYHDDPVPDRFSLGAVADVYAGYVAKRMVAYRLARRSSIRTGAAFAISLNQAALEDATLARHLGTLLQQCHADEVILDVAPTMRQIIVKKKDLPERLRMLLAVTGPDLQGCILREYLRGSYGALSSCDGQGGYLVELSSQGLHAINRGTAASARIRVSDVAAATTVDGDIPVEVRSALPTMLEFTHVLDGVLHGAQLEWVIVDGHAVFVDYSTTAHAIPNNRANDRAVVISSGVAQGPIIEIGDHALLERLSMGPAVSLDRNENVIAERDLGSLCDVIAASREKPIVLARAPYAVLSILVDRVAGFVFEQGAVLSHLGIILRESRLPAIIHPNPPRSGVALIADGSVTVVTEGSSL